MNLIVSNHDFDHDLFLLHNKIHASRIPFKKIVGIRHGGIHLSKPLAQHLGLPHEEVHISRREGEVVLENINYTTTTNDILLVDDIVDDGWTVRQFWQHFNPMAKVATMYMNSHGLVRPDFHVRQKDPGNWVVFPWEM